MPRPARGQVTQARFFLSDDLDGHMALVKRQVDESLQDPETIMLARKIVSGTFDYVEDPRTGRRLPVVEAWGKRFHAPPMEVCVQQDDACELGAIWTFLVENMRYVYDPDSADTFATLKVSLLSGSGDCDDQTVAVCAIARALGFTQCFARVISTQGEQWEHVFPIVGCPKDNPQTFIPLDMTVPGKPPGWHVPNPAAFRDFPMFDQ
jgi:hypothetical protein